MKPFETIRYAQFWLGMHAEGDCCILVNQPTLGTVIYGYQHSANLFRSLYGPLPETLTYNA